MFEREISVEKITEAVREMCVSVNYELSEDIKKALETAAAEETSAAGRQVLSQLKENLKIAREEQIPICQDTGMAVVFLDIGQDAHLTGGDLEAAVNRGVRQAYEEGYLRKSVVDDPLRRVNTGDNTPAVIHTRVVPGNKVRIRVTTKGFGSENTSRLYMLKPAQGQEGVKQAVLETVREAGPNACPPVVVGVGIGGTFEKAALMAKEALLTNTKELNEIEKDLLREINSLGIGPAGLGGKVTALAVHVKTFPTHIAGLPVAVNICCHVNRHAEREI